MAKKLDIVRVKSSSLPVNNDKKNHQQPELFHVEALVEIDGIEMGVLENGIPYLTESGLARMCGIRRSVLYDLSQNWQEEKLKPRGSQINNLLQQSNYFEDNLYLKSEHNGTIINAYTEPVCLSILEYYAFIIDDKRQEAINAFRTLAKTTFRNFIYHAVGYSPEQKALESWKHFHDRIDMVSDSVPTGYFSVFSEIAMMIVPMIKKGILISDKLIPDISVGRCWSEYWTTALLEQKYGERTKYDHEYPDYYPQSKSNPQSSYAYPEACLHEFREWLRNNYIRNKFPAYLLNQSKQGKLEQHTATKALEAFSPMKIEKIPRHKNT